MVTSSAGPAWSRNKKINSSYWHRLLKLREVLDVSEGRQTWDVNGRQVAATTERKYTKGGKDGISTGGRTGRKEDTSQRYPGKERTVLSSTKHHALPELMTMSTVGSSSTKHEKGGKQRVS